MIRSAKFQACAASVAALALVAAAFWIATFYAFIALGVLVFAFCRIEQMDERPGYKIKKHLYGLAAWVALVLTICVPHTWTYSQKEHVGRAFVSCLAVGLPSGCADMINDLYGDRNISPMSSVMNSIDWQEALKACRNGSMYEPCLKELAASSYSTGFTLTGADLDMLCPSETDKTTCYIDLLKSGVSFDNVGITPQAHPADTSKKS